MHIIHIGEGNGNPLQYSCLENPMDGRACWATVHGVTKSRTRLSDFTFTFNIHMGFPGGTSGKEFICQSRRHKRSGLDLWVGKTHWRKPWQPTPIFLPGVCHGQRSLVGYSPQVQTESDTTEATQHTHYKYVYIKHFIQNTIYALYALQYIENTVQYMFI